MRPGDCFDPIFDADDGSLLAGRVHDCISPHLAEVFAVFDDEAPRGAPYPGDDAIERNALARCDEEFLEYVGLAADVSRLGSYVWVAPLQSSWESGDRHFLCAVETHPAQPFVTSVRGSKR